MAAREIEQGSRYTGDESDRGVKWRVNFISSSVKEETYMNYVHPGL